MNIVGHQKILDYFNRSLKNGSLSHAYLFTGPRDVGKKRVARWLIEQVLTSHAELGSASKKTRHSLAPASNQIQSDKISDDFWSRVHPDITWLAREEDKKNITIEQIRNLRDKLKQSAFLASHKIAIIEEAHEMTKEAANALLKTLEEPSGQALLILTSSRPRDLPPTIHSRAEIINFSRVSAMEIGQALKDARFAKQADELSRLCHGLPERAFAMAKDSKLYDAWQQSAKDLLKLLQESRAERLAYVESLTASKKSILEKVSAMTSLLRVWQSLSRDLLLSHLGLSDKLANIGLAKDIEKISSQTRLAKLVGLQREIGQAVSKLQLNANPKLVLGNMLINV